MCGWGLDIFCAVEMIVVVFGHGENSGFFFLGENEFIFDGAWQGVGGGEKRMIQGFLKALRDGNGIFCMDREVYKTGRAVFLPVERDENGKGRGKGEWS